MIKIKSCYHAIKFDFLSKKIPELKNLNVITLISLTAIGSISTGLGVLCLAGSLSFSASLIAGPILFLTGLGILAFTISCIVRHLNKTKIQDDQNCLRRAYLNTFDIICDNTRYVSTLIAEYKSNSGNEPQLPLKDLEILKKMELVDSLFIENLSQGQHDFTKAPMKEIMEKAFSIDEVSIHFAASLNCYAGKVIAEPVPAMIYPFDLTKLQEFCVKNLQIIEMYLDNREQVKFVKEGLAECIKKAEQLKNEVVNLFNEQLNKVFFENTKLDWTKLNDFLNENENNYKALRTQVWQLQNQLENSKDKGSFKFEKVNFDDDAFFKDFDEILSDVTGDVVLKSTRLLEDLEKTFEMQTEANSSLEDRLKALHSAYKKWALRHHPDKRPNDPDATLRFQLVNQQLQELKELMNKSNRT